MGGWKEKKKVWMSSWGLWVWLVGGWVGRWVGGRTLVVSKWEKPRRVFIILA